MINDDERYNGQHRGDGRDLSIVMADDDRNDHLLMVMAAEAAGCSANFTFVEDGAELLLWLSGIGNIDQLPDIVILDLKMPGLDGHRTLDRLQAHPILWQVPVVVFTSSTRPSDEAASHALGARWFETKPSEFDDMVSFVDRLVIRATHGPYEAAEPDGELSDSTELAAYDLVGSVEDYFGAD